MTYAECGKCGYSSMYRIQLLHHWFKIHPEWKKYIPEKTLDMFERGNYDELLRTTDWKKLGAMK